MDVEYHVGSPVPNDSIRMCPHVVEELGDTEVSILSRSRLLGGNVRECHEYCRINGTCII